MNDYKHIDDETPSLTISLYKEYRRQGIGTDMRKNAVFVENTWLLTCFSFFSFKRLIMWLKCIENWSRNRKAK